MTWGGGNPQPLQKYVIFFAIKPSPSEDSPVITVCPVEHLNPIHGKQRVKRRGKSILIFNPR